MTQSKTNMTWTLIIKIAIYRVKKVSNSQCVMSESNCLFQTRKLRIVAKWRASPYCRICSSEFLLMRPNFSTCADPRFARYFLIHSSHIFFFSLDDVCVELTRSFLSKKVLPFFIRLKITFLQKVRLWHDITWEQERRDEGRTWTSIRCPDTCFPTMQKYYT